MTHDQILEVLRDSYESFDVNVFEALSGFSHLQAINAMVELEATGQIRPAPGWPGRYEALPLELPAPSQQRPHLHTGDVDIWTATYGAPLQIGQWVRVKPGCEWGAHPGAFMVRRLALDIRSGALQVSAINDRGLALTNWIIRDLEPATHGHR